MAKKKADSNQKNKTFVLLPAFIALTAALVASIVMLVIHASTLRALLTILGFLVGFYILGSILTAVLNAVATKEELPPENDGELENIQTSETEETSSES